VENFQVIFSNWEEPDAAAAPELPADAVLPQPASKAVVNVRARAKDISFFMRSSFFTLIFSPELCSAGNFCMVYLNILPFRPTSLKFRALSDNATKRAAFRLLFLLCVF
jgi:hypothetical protein